MVKPVLNYEKMVEDAMRGVVREALRACIDGIPGAHHFFISFRTRFPGVEIADYIRGRYPDEMTIVLQHQFWGLEVSDDRFVVTLSFNRIGEKLEIPFAAITKFADPSAKWGMEFQVDSELERPMSDFFDMEESADSTDPDAAARDDHGDEIPTRLPTAKVPADPAAIPEGGAQVVALDAFRKK